MGISSRTNMADRISKVFGEDLNLQRRTFAATGLTILIVLPLVAWFRVRIGDVHPSLPFIIIIAMVSCLPAVFCSRYPKLERFAGHLLLAVLTISFIAFININGGLNAPFLVAAPILPLVAAFLLGPQAGVVMASAVALYLIALVAGPLAATDINQVVLENNQRMLANGLFVAVVGAVVAAVGLGYELRFRRLQAALFYSATHDSLTGLANRQSLESALMQTTTRKSTKKPVSLIVVDIDHFKQFNDCHGHQAGDAILKEVATTALASAKRSRDVVARYGGDEFILVLPNTNTDDAIRVAERLRISIERKRFHLSNPELHGEKNSGNDIVTLSIGVATQIPGSDCDPQTFTSHLMALADGAMYRSKNAGRNCVVASEIQPLSVSGNQQANAA